MSYLLVAGKCIALHWRLRIALTASLIWIRLGNGDDQGLLGSCAVVNRAKTCPLVGHPPRTAGTARHAPRIDQLRVRDASNSGGVGNKVDRHVVLPEEGRPHNDGQCCLS